MRRIHIQKALLLSILFSSALFADIHDRIEYKLNRVLRDVEEIIGGNTANCTPITQGDINLGGGTFTITTSGDWCLADNVQGTIVIDASSVCLDLNCHIIDANGADNAITAGGQQSLKIFNGTVTNATDAGIDLVSCEDVTVSSINFVNNTDISLYIHSALVGACPSFTVSNPSQGILVENCNITGGNRAMLFRGCNELHVEACDVYENVNTIANAVVSIEHCNDVVFEEVLVNNNTKAVPSQGTGPLLFEGPETAVMLVQSSDNVQIRNCQTNSNTASIVGAMITLQVTGIEFDVDCGPVTGLTSGIVIDGHQSNNNTNITGILTGMSGFFVPSMRVMNSQTNGNVTTRSANGLGAFLTQGFTMGFASLGCERIYIQNHQSNENKSLNDLTSVAGESYGIFVAADGELEFLADGAIIENCQANNNGDFDQGSKSTGICLGYGTAAEASNGAIVRGCQVNGTAAHACVCAFGCYWNHVVYEHCQADNNRAFGTPDPANNCAQGYGFGFALAGDVSDVRYISCTASNNSCVNFAAAGFDASSYPPFSIGAQPILISLPPENVIYEDCVAHDNTSVSSFGCGFRAALGVDDCVIQDSDAFSNTTTGTGSGHGILFDTTQDSKIIRSQMHENDNNGIELIGSNTTIAIIECVAMDNGVNGFDFAATSTANCCLVQDCRALSNANIGFAHLTSPLTTTFIGNEAQCNNDGETTDNFVINGGIISLYELSWTTGLMTNISGQATISPWTNVSAVS